MAQLVDWLFFSGARKVNGDPVATGTVYFYDEGSTSELADIYADEAETTPKANPVTLDAAGRAEVYIKVPAEVKVLDSTGATVRLAAPDGIATDAGTVKCTWGGTDDVPLSTVLSEVETNLGDGVMYQEDADIAEEVQRTYHDVLRQFISPYDFGAEGDGIVDDTAPLQYAINRAAATGLPLNLETGTFKFTTALVAASPVSIYGAGASEAVLVTTATGLDGLTLVAADNYLRDFSVQLPHDGTTYDKAIAITGDGCIIELVSVTGGQGIYSEADRTIVNNCTVEFGCPNSSGNGYGIWLGGSQSQANACSVTGLSSAGTYLTVGIGIYGSEGGPYAGRRSRAAECLISTCRIGGVGGLFDGCTFYTCATGWSAAGGSGVDSVWTGARDCQFDDCTANFDFTDAFYPVNRGNHANGSDIDLSYKYTTSASATPAFTVEAGYDSYVFNCSYDGSATPTITVAGGGFPRGKVVQVVVQATSDCDADVGWAGDVVVQTGGVHLTGPLAFTAVFLMGTDDLVQITTWVSVADGGAFSG